MEENPNLLEDFVQKDSDLIEYRKSYSTIRTIAIITTALLLVVFILIFNKRDHAPGIAHKTGSVAGSTFAIIFLTSLPAAVFSSLISFFTDKKISYRERIKKFFWMTCLGISILYILLFSGSALILGEWH